MEIKSVEEKLVKRITNVNNALNISNKKISSKINEMMKEIAELQKIPTGTDRLEGEKCKCKCINENSEIRNNMKALEQNINTAEAKIKTLEVNSSKNYDEIKSLDSEISNLKAVSEANMQMIAQINFQLHEIESEGLQNNS